MKKRTVIIVLLVSLFLITFLIIVYNKSLNKDDSCARYDTRVCPDGSASLPIPPDCNYSPCPELKEFVLIENQSIFISCNADEDCILINRDIGFRCCGYECGLINYSLDRWVAVNNNSFLPIYKDKLIKNDCFNVGCVPCVGILSEDSKNITTKCINKICQKVSK